MTNEIEENETMLFQQWEVDGGPFTVVKMDEKFFVTMGRYRVTQPMETKDEAFADAREINWHRIMQVVQIMIDENQPKTK